MSATTKASDWECVGVATAGGAVGWGIGVGVSASLMRGYFIRLSAKKYY